MTPYNQSFEEIYKTAYSHGLESIYALENVDLKSVRPLTATLEGSPNEKSQSGFQSVFANECQLKLPFEPKFSERLDSFILEEPLYAAGLSRYAEKCLQDHGKNVIRDVVSMSKSDFIFMKGLGQGHIDEILQRVQQYVSGKELLQTSRLDFAAWLRSNLKNIDRRKAYLLLEKYGLSHLIVLTPAEFAEVRRLPLEVRTEFSEDARLQLKSKLYGLDKIVHAFVLPWMQRRLGLATEEEIYERLMRVSINANQGEAIFGLIQKEVYDHKLPFEDLVFLEGSLYAVDSWVRESYEQIKKLAFNYLYNERALYPFYELKSRILNELAIKWSPLTCEFVEKVLRYCPQFIVKKKLELTIRIKPIALAT